MPKILLIEDDPFLVDVYSTKFQSFGFEVESATNGQEGLKKIAEKSPDVLVLDIVLPGANGWEILEEVKKEKILKNFKIIILSNLAEKEEVEKGLSLGADKYLIKAHYTPSQVAEEIKKIL